MDEADYGEAGEAKLKAFVEATTGGKVTRMERQVRWRPAWFVDVERDGERLALHLRGDRSGDVAIFPELRREADVIDVLHGHGIAVPRIYGFCEDPQAILMDALPGVRDMAQAPSDAARQAILQDYMAQVAAMHRLPLAPFTARGIEVPEGADDIALAGVRAYLPLYLRTKSKPEPMLEFLLGWIRRNTPKHRTQAAFIQFDSGQFLQHDGKLTGLYDFEFAMVGDPLVDIATMRMRDSYEPMGVDLRVACQLYEAASGQPIDDGVVDFHTLQFATIATMQFAGTVGALKPDDPHSVYLEFDLALRQVTLLAICSLTGIVLDAEPPPKARTGDNAVLIAKLSDTLSRIETASPIAESHKDSAAQLIEWLVRSDAAGAEMRQRDLADVSALLGRGFEDWPEAEAALERHVQDAGPDQDERLLRLFGAIEARRMHLYSDTRIGASAAHVRLPPIR